MSDQDSSLSMNSLMEAIYGDHQTQYFMQHQDQYLEQMPLFMQTLINYLIQLCVTQGFADNVQRTLSPWIKQVKFNTKNPKQAIQGFLKEFLRLYEQQTQKINKYGQKKLKFLIKTVSKQIFTEIMRTACDLKLESVNRSNSLYIVHKKTNNITILSSCISLILTKDIKYSFAILKKTYSHAINKQQKFISNFTNCISKLDRLCIKKRKNKLWKAMGLWRKNSIDYAKEESLLVFSYAKEFFKTTLPQIVKVWQYKPANWLTVIIQHLSNLVRSLVGDHEGIVFEFIPNPNIQAHNSLNYSAISSYRSGISQISSIEVEQYLKNQQIKYSTISKFLAIPIIAEQQIGLIKISWQYQLPIVLFNRTLRLVELIKQIIHGYAKITTRLGYYNLQYDYSSWHQQLLQLAFRQEPLDIGAFQNIFCAANITLIQIYHDKNTPAFCIKYDKQNAKQIPNKIYELIWEKLENSPNFKLDRENRNYQIIKLDHQHGFCRYSFQEMEETKNINKSAIIQCIVPLLTKNLGKIGCKHCNIKVKQLIPSLISVLQQPSSKDQSLKIDYDYRLMMKLKDAHTINQMQLSFFQLLKKSFPKKPLFARILYFVSQEKNIFAYKNIHKNSIESIQLPKLIVNQNSFSLQVNQIDQKLVRVIKLLHSNPLFQQAELYIYQSEKRKRLNVEVKKVGRRAILIIGTYQKNMQDQLKLLLKATGGQIEQNKQILQKKDIYSWSSQILDKKNSINTINMLFSYNYLAQIHEFSFSELMKRVTDDLPHVQSFFMWAISNQKPTLLIGNTIQQLNFTKFPFKCLVNQSIKSHHTVKGSHRVTRLSKNCGKKIQQILTYIPNWSTQQQKFKYAEVVNSYMEQVGQQTDQCFNQVSQYLSRSWKFSKTKNQFISIPVEFNKKTYILMLIYSRQTYINLQNFIALQTYLKRIVIEILDKKYLKMKQLSLSAINQFRKTNNMQFVNIKTHNKIKQIINKYKENVIKRRIRDTKMEKILKKSYQNNLYRCMKQSFSKIYRNSKNILQKYQKNCQLLIRRIQKTFAYQLFFQILHKSFNYLKGFNKLQRTYKRILTKGNCQRVSKNMVFLMIQQYGKGKKEIKQNRRYVSLKIIKEKMQKIKRRNMLQVFIKNIQNLLSLKRSLRILQEQFILMEPKNVRVCIEFIIGRLNLMLNQHYAMPIAVQMINCGFQPAQTSKILQKENFVFVQNSSFAFTIVIKNGNEISCQRLNNLVENTLIQILPKWQINHRKHQIMRLKIIYELLQRYRRGNLMRFFWVRRSEKSKEDIQNCQGIRKKANRQRQKMLQLQYSCNTSVNLQNRQKHRRQMEQLKQNTNVIQNQLYRIGVEVKIKSKTNSAYKMLSILNKNTFHTRKNQNEQNLCPNNRSQLQEIQQNCREDRQRHFHQALPIWHYGLTKIFKRNYKSQAHQFMNRLHNLYA